jgi:anti-sigma regulatory factor (Ser/Thr protein kinase)
MEVLVASVAVAAILKGPMGADGIWLSFLIGECLTLIITLIVVWVMGKHGSLMDRILMLPEGFGGRDEDRLSVSIGNSMDEVMDMIKRAYEFGENHGINISTLDKVSLCIEELAGNIVQHAFKPGEKRWFDLLIYVKEDRIFIRMRDNGRPFDPLTYLREQAEDDPEAGIGLKIINGITENFEYHSGVGLNISVMTLKIRGR